MGDAFAPGPPPPPEVATQPTAPVAVMAPPPPPESASPPPPPQQAPGASAPPPPEDARQRIMALSPDPAQADAKLSASEQLGKWLRMNPADVHGNFAPIAEHIFGDSAKGQTPATIGQKVSNMFKGQQLAAQDADLAGKMFLGDDSQATKDARAAVKKQQAELGPTLGWLPQQAAGIAFQLGYQVEHATDTVAYTGLSILSGELLSKTLGMNPKTHFLEAAEGESSKVFGSLVGGSYGSLIDRGVDPTYARMAAAGLGALQVGMMAIPIGQEVAKPVGDALIDGVIRPMLNGAIDKTAASVIPKAAAGKLATTLGMDAATAETAGAFGKQGLMAVGMATANAALPEVAASLSNRLKGTHVELKSPGELAGEIAQGAAGQFLVGAGAVGAHEALRSMVQTHIENAVSAAADRELAKQAQEARFEEAVKASAEKAKAAEIPEHPIEAATREMQAKQTIGDIVDREPQLPEVKPAEGKTVSDEQLKAMLDKAKEAHGEDIKMPGVTKDWHDAVRMDPNDEGKAVLWYNDAEGGTHAIVEPLEAKATERPSTGNGGINKDETSTEPATRPVTPAMSEEQGRVLDEATRTEEGSADYIERRPDVQELTKKISDLQLQVDQGKTDAKAALEAAKEDKAAAVKSLRAQMDTRVQMKKDISRIDEIVKGAKYMEADLGEAVKAIGEKLNLKGKTAKANLDETLRGELSKVVDAIQASPDRGPTIDLNKLREASTVKIKDLPPAIISDLADALSNLDWIQRMREKVRTTQGDIERSALRTDTLPRIKGMKLTAEEMANKEPTLGKTFKAAVRDAKSEGGVLANTYDMNAEIVFGGQDNDAYRTVGRDMLEASYALEPAQNALKSPIMDDHLKSLGIDHRTNPEKYNAMRGRRVTEDNVTATYGEIMSWYMMFKDANHKESLLNGTRLEHWDAIDTHDIIKIPEETFQKMFSHLDPKDVKMMDEVAPRQLMKATEALQKDHEDRYGYPMKEVENRWPKFVIKGEKANFATDLEDLQKSKQWIRLHVDESRTIERTGSTAPVYTRDFYSTIQEDLNQSALITTMAKRAKAAADILWDPVIGPKLERQFGKPRINMMRDDLKYMAGQKDTPRGFENAMDTAGNWTGIIDLAGNIKSGVKQAALAIRSAIQFGTLESTMKTLADVVFHRNGSRETSRATSKLYDSQTRRGGTLDQTQMLRKELAISSPGVQGEHPILEGAARVVSRARTIGKRAGMAFNRAGTDFAYNFDATLGRRQAEIEFRRASQGKQMSEDFKNITGLKEGDVPGLSPADKTIAAGKFSDAIIGQTHASNIRGQEAGIQKFPVMRFLTKFKSEGIKGFEVVRRTMMQAHRNPTAQNIWKATRVTAFYAIGEGLMFYGMDQAGTAITNAIRGLVGKEPLPEPKRNRKEMLGDVAKSIGREDAGMVLGLGDMAVEGYNLAVNPQQPNMGPVEQTLAMAPQSFAAVLKMINPHSNQVEKDKAWKQLLSSLTDTGLTTFGLSQRPLRGLLK